MRIAGIQPQADSKLRVVSEDGRIGLFDVSPYFEFEAFAELKDVSKFSKVLNGGYFVEWECGADLSADTIEARWNLLNTTAS